MRYDVLLGVPVRGPLRGLRERAVDIMCYKSLVSVIEQQVKGICEVQMQRMAGNVTSM